MKRLLSALFALLLLPALAFGQAFDFPSNPTLNQQVTGPNGAIYQWDGTKWVAVGGGGGGGFTAGGDLSGTATSQSVIGIRSTAVPALGSGYLHYNGTAFVWDTPAGGGGGTVNSVGLSGGTTGLTVAGSPITSSGTMTLGGTLAIASGGTGATTAGAALTNLGGAPTASPTFTGTVTMPGAGTFTTTGYNNAAGIGVGTAAVAGTVAVTNNQNGNTTVIQGLNNNAGTAAQVSSNFNNGTSVAAFGLLGTGYSGGASLPADSLYFYNAGTNGMEFVNAPASGVKQMSFWVNSTTLAGAFGTGGGTGGLTVGSPTGGDKGLGTVNATAFYVNGVALSAGSGTVTSVALSGGTTGLTVSGSPITTSGTITLAGTLGLANGGTNATSAATARTSLGAAPTASPTFTGTVTLPDNSTVVSGLGGMIIKNDANYPAIFFNGTTTQPNAAIQTQGAGTIWMFAGMHQNAAGSFIADATQSAGLGINSTSFLFDLPSGSTVGSAVTHNYVVQWSTISNSFMLTKITSGTAGTGGGTGGGALCLTSGTNIVSNAANCIASSLTLKTAIRPLDGALATIEKLAPAAIYYRYKQGADHSEQPGFGAETIAKIDPRYATYQNGKPAGVRYEQMAATEAAAIAEQQKEIEELRAEVKQLRGR
jgi:hypothetical protein